MKRNPLLKLCAFAVIAVSYIACENEPLDDGDYGIDDPTVNANFQVTIEEQGLFTSDQAGASTQEGITAIAGSDSDGNLVSMVVSGSSEGSYNLEGSVNGRAEYYSPGGGDPYETTSNVTGTLTIDEYNLTNGVISGTFEFAAIKEIPVENEDDEETEEEEEEGEENGEGEEDDEENGGGEEEEIETVTDTLDFTEGSFTNIPLNSDQMPEEEDEYYIAFEVEGVAYVFEAYTADSMSRLIRGEEGIGDTYTSMSLWMPVDIAEGTYDIDDSPEADYEANYTNMVSELNIDATSGILNVTTITEDYIEGTFNFVGVDEEDNEVSISEGEFKAPNL